MKNYVERLNKKRESMKEENITIADITPLYWDFKERDENRYNYIYNHKIKPFLKLQFEKRKDKPDFDKKMFSKILFNNLYKIRQNKNDLVPFYCKKEDETYKYFASHQYIRKELERMTIDEIIVLSYEMIKYFK